MHEPPLTARAGGLSRRRLLAGAGAAVLLAGCGAGPGFIDVSDPGLLRYGVTVHLVLGQGGHTLHLGSTRDTTSTAITARAERGRVLIDGGEAGGQVGGPTGAPLRWSPTITPTAVGGPREPGDVVIVTTRHGRLRVEVWIEPPGGAWTGGGPGGSPLDLGVVAVHAALMGAPGRAAEIVMWSPPRSRDAAGAVRFIEHEGHRFDQWDYANVRNVEIRALDLARMVTRARSEEESGLRPENLFCVGQAHLADGRLLTAGGHVGGLFPEANFIHIYNPGIAAGGWTRPEIRLREARWYPTVVTMPDGRPLVLSGAAAALTQGIESIFLRFYENLHNTYELLDERGDAFIHLGDRLPELTDRTGLPGERPLATYPAAFTLPGSTPGGVLFLQEANRGWLYAYEPGRRHPLARAGRRYDMPGTGSRSYPHYGSAVLLPFRDGDTAHTVLVAGGQEESVTDHKRLDDDAAATRSTVLFGYRRDADLTAQPGWRPGPEMRHPRMLCDATILPDGTVLVTGGVSRGWANHSIPEDAVRQAELYDPDANVFRPMAAARLDRRYHSTTLLLPDASVMAMGSTGGFSPGTDRRGRPWTQAHTQAERFLPPYLWRSAPPVIERVTAAVPLDRLGYGQQVDVHTRGRHLEAITVELVRPGAVTHGFNTGQRLIVLTATEHVRDSAAGADSRWRTRVRLPADPAAAPPGVYMLFVVNERAVPSTAAFVRLAR
ncbi:galactose oxidase-like domain-containing protein [Nonomuraea typhae]|uniref:galactose oxidase-like domain-containing protein n=1 Tax=Nonomuraea typhae TaxID=2603600 RepID=UPI0012F89245|nr:galactose oxidase-like domain-containing protein [Nonomuraea typhae]